MEPGRKNLTKPDILEDVEVAISAGSFERTARSTSPRLLTKDDIARAIGTAREQEKAGGKMTIGKKQTPLVKDSGALPSRITPEKLKAIDRYGDPVREGRVTQEELDEILNGIEERDLARINQEKRMCSTTGASDPELAENVREKLEKFCGNNISLKAALAFLESMKPSDPIEGMLISQMYATHALAMEFMARTSHNTDPDFVSMNLERSTKLTRTFTTQMEALNRYRGKGQQKVTVEHVTVHQGGQAMIGSVDRGVGRDREEK